MGGKGRSPTGEEGEEEGSEEEDTVGKLRMRDVRELPDDIDSIIGKFRDVDYGD